MRRGIDRDNWTPPDFDREESERLKEEGMDKALAAERVQAWKVQATFWIDGLAVGLEFTMDDMTRSIGVPDTGQNRNNVMGAFLNGRAQRGMIVKTGEYRPSERVERQGGIQAVWRKR